MRFIYAMSVLHFAACAAVAGAYVLRHEPPRAVIRTVTGTSPEIARPFEGGNAWFRRNKQYCNALEVDTMMRRDPPGPDAESVGYQAACYALAAKIEAADAAIQTLPDGQRPTASGIVFNVGHPIADAGDDRSAGPIMNLVLKYWPGNYQAEYHAGMSEFALGQFKDSRRHLTNFVGTYKNNDFFRQQALSTLEKLKERGDE